MTEYIYQDFYRAHEKELSLHQTLWTTGDTQSDILAFGTHLEGVIAQVRKEKSEKQLSMKEPIPKLLISCPMGLRGFYEKSLGDIMACTGAGRIVLQSQPQL